MNPLQKFGQAARKDSPGGHDCHTSDKQLLPLNQPQPALAGISSKQVSNGGAKSYAQVVQQSPEGRGKEKDTRRTQSLQHPKRFTRPVEPVNEGRCFRCLGHGHAARECQDPIVCRLCRSPGHR